MLPFQGPPGFRRDCGPMARVWMWCAPLTGWGALKANGLSPLSIFWPAHWILLSVVMLESKSWRWNTNKRKLGIWVTAWRRALDQEHIHWTRTWAKDPLGSLGFLVSRITWIISYGHSPTSSDYSVFHRLQLASLFSWAAALPSPIFLQMLSILLVIMPSGK